MNRSILLLVLLQLATSCHGFVEFPQLTSRRPTFQTVFSTKPRRIDHQNVDDFVELRADIRRMREEASMRMEALNEKLIVASQQKKGKDKAERKSERESEPETNTKKNPPIIASLTAPATSSTARADRVNLDDAKTMENLTEIADAFERDMHLLNEKKELKAKTAALAGKSTETRHPLKLLDDTRWRVMLNAHRVRGTWMPKTWGASGDQLRMKVEIEFTTEELYEREDFFNGLSDGSKVLRVIRNEATMAPTMTEGGKNVRVSDGGWRVCPKEGPHGTAILRWYFNVEEEACHLGSDVYVPAGRVYGTCGYFPMIGRSNVDGRGSSKREVYQQELRQKEVKYLSLKEEMDHDMDVVSIDKFKRFHEMREIRREAKEIKKTIDEELVREPVKSSLRLSRDQSVGLTHEGGICCRKQNGLSKEYHVLGKFEVASIENREYSDYRDILRP
jgi:hypothetical protein